MSGSVSASYRIQCRKFYPVGQLVVQVHDAKWVGVFCNLQLLLLIVDVPGRFCHIKMKGKHSS